VEVDELAPDMSHAGDLVDVAGPVDVLEPGIAIHRLRLHLGKQKRREPS